jgi:murein DD-endopeptidase MepM/ murein hydrolase activator NlpD
MTATPRAQRYTLILVRGPSQAIRKFEVPRRWVTHLLFAVGALSLLGSIAATHYLAQLGNGSENRVLRQENERLRSQVRLVQARVAHIAATLDRVEGLDAKLRGAACEPQASRSLAIGPVGKREDERPPATAAPAPVATAGGSAPALAVLESAATRQESSLRALHEYFEDQHASLASAPSVWPTRGWVTSDFGVRVDPYTAERVMHRGLDIATPQGQAVYAPSDATVTFAGTENGYGKVVVLDHGFGISTRYGHLSQIDVRAGQRVSRGARVASVGNTGRSTGPHLHYEVLVNGIAENPRKFLLE